MGAASAIGQGKGSVDRGVSRTDGEGAAEAAELEAFGGYPAQGEEVAESVFPEAKGGADPGRKPLGEASPAVGVLELVEELADSVSQLSGAAEVDGALAAVVAIDELEIGTESASAIGTPGGDDGALGGEALGVLEE